MGSSNWNDATYISNVVFSIAKRCSYNSPAQRSHPIPNPTHPLIALKQERPMMCYIFEKEIVQGPQKQCSQVKNKNLENLENLENQENQEKQKKTKKPKKPKKTKKTKKKPKKTKKKTKKTKKKQKPKKP